MESKKAVLTALSRETLLEAFRLLVKHEPDGFAAGELARLLAVPQSTLFSPPPILARGKTPPRRAAKGADRRNGRPRSGPVCEKGTPYREGGLDDPKRTNEQLADQILAHQPLINGQIAVTPKSVRLSPPCKVVEEVQV